MPNQKFICIKFYFFLCIFEWKYREKRTFGGTFKLTIKSILMNRIQNNSLLYEHNVKYRIFKFERREFLANY